MEKEEIESLKKWKEKIPFPEELRDIYLKENAVSKLQSSNDPSNTILDSIYKSGEKFYICSGRLVLTTEGESEYATELIWDLPKGTYKIEFGKKNSYDIALIKFHEPFEDVYQFPVLFSAIHPESKTKNYTSVIEGTGSQLLAVDKKIWNNEKSFIYSKDPEDLKLFQIKYKYLSPGSLLITNIPSAYSDAVADDDKTTHEYKAFAGFNRNGEFLYLLIQRKSDYQYTNKQLVK